MLLALTNSDLSRTVRLLPALAVIGAAGCVASPQAMRSEVAPAAQAEHAVSEMPVVRYARYTLVEVRPDAAQQDLLEQIVNTSLPRTVETKVGDALSIVLSRTGYELCEPNSDTNVLYALPLPDVHRQLGPLTLRDALQTLAGPAWTLDIDSVARRVCFVRNEGLDPAADLTERPKGSKSSKRGDGSSQRKRRG